MGYAADAHLVYGIIVGDEDGTPWESAGFDEWEDWYLDKAGVKSSNYDYDWEMRPGGGYRPTNSDEYERYRNDYHDAMARLDGISIAPYGYLMDNGHAYYFLTAKSINAFGYSPRIVTTDDLNVEDALDERIRKACDILGIEYSQPGWHLIATYG